MASYNVGWVEEHELRVLLQLTICSRVHTCEFLKTESDDPINYL